MSVAAFAIPSPTQGVWHLGPFPIRGYALCILAGIGVALLLTRRRWVARGGEPATIERIAWWAIPFGILGGRLYHLITDPELYFVPGRDPWNAFKIWDGGLGIWGAVALGGVGAWIGARRAGVSVVAFADAAAPGLAFAQAIGRWGNWFNNELYGRPTSLPWRLRIYQWDSSAGHAVRDAAGHAIVKGYYHPTFLYECLWDIGVGCLVIWAGRRFDLSRGRSFALYVAAYTVGRAGVEALRIDHANHILGLRLNDWMSLIVFAGAITYLIVRRRGGAPTSGGGRTPRQTVSRDGQTIRSQ